MTNKRPLTAKQKAKIIKKRKQKILIKKVSNITFLINLVSTIVLFVMIISFNFLPLKYLILFGVVLGLILLILGLLALVSSVKSGIKVFQSILCIILTVITITSAIILPNYLGKLERMFVSVPKEGSLNINVYVLNESGFDDIEDLAGKLVAIQQNLDLDYQGYAIKVVNKEIVGEDIKVMEVENIYDAMEKLYAQEVDAVMLNQDYVKIIKENKDFSDFDSKVKLLYQCTQKITITTDIATINNVAKEPFVVAITGVDEWDYSYISPSARVRSDVNIVLVVNPINKQILMVTVPRDSYVPLDGDYYKMDKLTHAPTLSDGINCWINTLNEVLGIEINYYLRVNFTSLINIVNAIGGIDVNNPYYFETDHVLAYNESTKTYYNRHAVFEEGLIHLTGEEALGYCRERYYVTDDGYMIGDLGRNQHQALVLKATIDKMSSVSIITKIGKLLESLEGKFTSNIESKEIYALAQMQLNDMADWQVLTYSLSGYSDELESYVVGDYLSMIVLDDDEIYEARQYIIQILNNQVIEMIGE